MQSVSLWGHCLSRVTVPPSAEKMLQNTPVQRLGGDPTNGVASGRLITRPRVLNITFKLLCKAIRTANLMTNYVKKTVKRKWKGSKHITAKRITSDKVTTNKRT